MILNELLLQAFIGDRRKSRAEQSSIDLHVD